MLDDREVVMAGAALVLGAFAKIDPDQLPRPHFEAELLETLSVSGDDDFDGFFDGPTETRTLSWAELSQRVLDPGGDDVADGGAEE